MLVTTPIKKDLPLGVSVIIITYNHEKYIATAIESILMQVTQYPLEIIIGEDNSSDNTRDIIKSFSKQYPQKIKVIYNATNLGMAANLIQCLNATSYKYISICEGDDYWLDERKIEIMLHFLENNKGFAGTGHAVYTQHENKNTYMATKQAIPMKHKTVHLKQLIKENPFATCSMTFRNYNYNLSPYTALAFLDWPLWIQVALNGPIALFDTPLGVYRIHQGGVHSSRKNDKTRGEINKIQFYNKLYEQHPLFYQDIIEPVLLLQNNLLTAGVQFPLEKGLNVFSYLRKINISINFSLSIKILTKMGLQKIRKHIKNRNTKNPVQ